MNRNLGFFIKKSKAKASDLGSSGTTSGQSLGPKRVWSDSRASMYGNWAGTKDCSELPSSSFSCFSWLKSWSSDSKSDLIFSSGSGVICNSDSLTWATVQSRETWIQLIGCWSLWRLILRCSRRNIAHRYQDSNSIYIMLVLWVPIRNCVGYSSFSSHLFYWCRAGARSLSAMRKGF